MYIFLSGSGYIYYLLTFDVSIFNLHLFRVYEIHYEYTIHFMNESGEIIRWNSKILEKSVCNSTEGA